jgi:uncharacterized membrane protein YhhN
MAVLVATLLWALRTRQPPIVQWIVKPLAAACFVALALWEGALERPWTTVLFVGLVFAAGGDVLLIPKSRRAFLAGLVSFLLGHVAYAVAFTMRGIDLTWTALAGAVCVVIAAPVLRWLWPHVEPKMRVPVAAYVVVITAMVALAIGTHGRLGDVRIVIGAVGFYLSDLAVARERFVAPGFVNRAWGLPLYFGAQLLLASTVSG